MINIVLLEPQIPQNTGNIARTCAATGSRLHLVKPMGFTVDDKKLKRAGLDYWHLLDITYYESTKEFFEKNQGEMYFFTTKGKKIYSDVSYPDGCYLVFGRRTVESTRRSSPPTTTAVSGSPCWTTTAQGASISPTRWPSGCMKP